jgi:uncharacterized protein
MASQTTSRPPLPPFTHDSAMQKVRLAEDGWNTRDPATVALAYTIDSRWRNRSEFIKGRSEVIAFLSRKWAKELDYRLIKEMWAFAGNRINNSGAKIKNSAPYQPTPRKRLTTPTKSRTHLCALYSRV